MAVVRSVVLQGDILFLGIVWLVHKLFEAIYEKDLRYFKKGCVYAFHHSLHVRTEHI